MTDSIIYLQLNDEAFKDLDVKKKHYDRVEDLTLDGNQLEKLENTQILDIPLGMRFSARNNKLTSVSHYFSILIILIIDFHFFRFPLTYPSISSKIQTHYYYLKTHGDARVIAKLTI